MRLGARVHWTNVHETIEQAQSLDIDALEYAMRPGDHEDHRDAAFDSFLPYRAEHELSVRAPPAMRTDDKYELVDLASPDAEHRARSTAFIGEVARHAMEMRADALIVTPGGTWRGNIGGNVELLRDSLEDLPRHVKILLENVPWYTDPRPAPGTPLGDTPAGFRMPAGLLRVEDLVDGYALDIAAAYLAVGTGTPEVARVLARELGPRIQRVTITGARAAHGIDGMGTPLDDSDYDATFVREILSLLPTDITLIAVPADERPLANTIDALRKCIP